MGRTKRMLCPEITGHPPGLKKVRMPMTDLAWYEPPTDGEKHEVPCFACGASFKSDPGGPATKRWELHNCTDTEASKTLGYEPKMPVNGSKKFVCDVCFQTAHVDGAVDRQDTGGNWFTCCPDCAGEYETVFVKETDGDWKLTKENHRLIERFQTRTGAKLHGEDVAFNVIVKSYSDGLWPVR